MLAVQSCPESGKKAFHHKSNYAAQSVDIYVRAEREKKSQFEGLFVPYIDGLYNMALRITRNSDDAEDLVQETYLKAYRFFANFQTDTNAKAWIMTIMMNTFRTKYRRSQREPVTIDYDVVENLLPADEHDSVRPPANKSEMRDIETITEYMRSVVSDDIMNALDSVPERFRMPVLLSDAEQFNYQEISEILGISIGTVKSRIFRGRRLLKRNLFKYAVDRGINRR
jgi:RNA polymerase sigma-70 factor (ECF subfamily)